MKKIHLIIASVILLLLSGCSATGENPEYNYDDYDADLAEIQDSVDVMEQRISDLEGENEDLSDKNSNLEGLVDELESRVSDLESELGY